MGLASELTWRGVTAFLQFTPKACAMQTHRSQPARLCSLKHAAVVSVALGMLSANIPGDLSASELLSIQGRPRVVDGDTFVFETAGQKRRVRLKALDAFELSQVCHDPSRGGDYQCGVKARDEMMRIIGNRETSCRGEGNDVFGRLVGTCVITDTGVDVGEQLVQGGWALAFRKFGNEYVRAEEQARAQSSGAWAGQFTEPWKFRAAKRAVQAGNN